MVGEPLSNYYDFAGMHHGEFGDRNDEHEGRGVVLVEVHLLVHHLENEYGILLWIEMKSNVLKLWCFENFGLPVFRGSI